MLQSIDQVVIKPDIKDILTTLVVRHVDKRFDFNYAFDLLGYDRDIEYMLNINVSTH